MDERDLADDTAAAERIGRRNRRDTLIVTAVFLVLVGVAFLGVKLLNPGYSREPFRRVEFVLDDYVTITAYGKDQSRVEEAVDAAFRELFRVQEVADRYRPESELARVNREAAGGPVKVSDELWEILETGMELYRASGGAFDITVGPLVDLWDVVGRGERGEPPPGEEEIAAAREAVGADKLELDAAARTVRFTRPGMVIDVGGMAKGYALDRAAEALRSRGITSGYISMISTDLTLGDKPSAAGGPSWRIAVLDPRGEGYLATLMLPGESYVSTSGDYQRYFEYQGVRYHHILDPRTGRPARGAVSVTVVGGRDGAWSDGLSTAAFVKGYPEGLEWLEAMEGVECLMVDASGGTHATRGMDSVLEEMKESAGS
jgi:thiamine biosynthesis lipoprotein